MDEQKARRQGACGQGACPLCPGCHFRCRLDRYQCGRGRDILAAWEETGSVPERPAGPPPWMRLSADERLAFGLNITANVVLEQRERRAETEVLAALRGHAGLASRAVLLQRTHLRESVYERAVRSLERDALAERSEDEGGRLRDALAITEAGRARADELVAARAEQDAELLAPLSAAEREQLDALLAKLFAPPGK